MLLYAAGEKHGAILPPGFSKDETPKLMHLSREAIRNHLITLDPEKHLFNRITLLKLPTIIQDCLLYGMYLEIDEDANDSR